jgi:hypothetical protein
MRRVIAILVLFVTLISCGQVKINTPEDALNKFEEFKKKAKFIEDEKYFYPGIGNPKLLSSLTNRINKACEDFKVVSQTESPTDKAYQDKIKIGLGRFSDLYLELDTEDRERVCHYFEELMDIVGLESSDGLLNNFMYGFDPSKNSKKE